MEKRRKASRREFLKESALAGGGLLGLSGLSSAKGNTAATSTPNEATIRPLALRCEYREDPLGIDALQPRLSWLLESTDPGARGQVQTAYQVLAASSEERLGSGHGDLWESGKIQSDRSTQVVYGGKPLASRQRAWWKVRVWDKAGRVSPWSKTAYWSMGLVSNADWTGKWIGLDRGEDGAGAGGAERRVLPARMLRKDFRVEGEVRRATLYLSGLGLFEAYLNGRKVSADVLAPALSDYDRRVFYLTYDVTGDIKPGDNAIGVILGNGRFFAPRLKDPPTRTFGFPKLLLQLEIERSDGKMEPI
ncbi:MAG TPA: alpha-L-rhamnosidase N-terminal domain-containing protein, partial [Terriglobia bacterium]|nr:alpha-L-rhamnosidase N-terminal domain-containing protein [Terriglobia bacterium]